ncbi:hypothetical protein PNEG_00896 [Pneumocystis murina B123]|uniref:Uncharacterized protein n=1 Tax=Pneumocystis murina (strain B123) TaxID=1069680 RepID=M7NU06_PNEMU|nr:hypothetical protein PNEG_00896 [Pneumocystis murina B123]EMR10747.1 hypothetical protein PNEG_00896 [Pneumocystis murina B123]
MAEINKINPEERLQKELLKIYLFYISGFKDKLRIINQWKISEKGKKYLKFCCLFELHKQLNLIGYSLPVQKMPLYKLLLLPLLKCHDFSIVSSTIRRTSFLQQRIKNKLSFNYMFLFHLHFPAVLNEEVSIVLYNDILIIFNSTYTSIAKTMNVKELQTSHIWKRHDTELHFMYQDLKGI